MKRLWRATVNSWNGLRYTFGSEASFRLEVFVLALAALLGFLIAPSPGWYVAMIGAILLVMIAELLNTAIERLADHVTPEHHPRIGAIKDAGSAAVGCALAVAGLVWLCALVTRIGLL